LGIELEGAYVFSNWLNASGNLTLSRNKIKSFTEYLDDYDANFDWKGQHAIVHENADISFSPSVVAAATINILPVKNLEINLLSKYVGTQYLDNTQSAAKKLDPFYTQDLRFIYVIKEKLFKEWNIICQVNNVFDMKYEPNGYTYGYIYDGSVITENFYFPMAGTNFVVGLNIKL
jgi:iron complex outermembrane receptor protein